MRLSSYLFVASEVGNSRKTFPLGVCGPLPNYQNPYPYPCPYPRTFQSLVQEKLGGLECLWYVYAFIRFISPRKKKE